MSHRMAVLGIGGLGMMLGKQVRRQPHAELVGLADINAPSRDQAGDILDVLSEARYEILDNLLTGEDLDTLVIATPHATLRADTLRIGAGSPRAL